MKKILLAVIFLVAFSSVGVTAQTVFVPRPPVVHIPTLNAAGMHIRNQVFRNMINGRAVKGGAKGAKTSPSAAAAIDYTLFRAREENYLPKLLAQAGKGNLAEQRETEQFYNSQIEMYEQTASYHKYPANDVAFALLYFISNNYEIYYDLITVPVDKDPWVKRAPKNSYEGLALLNTKKSRKVTPEQDRAMYFQFKEMLSAQPEFKKMTDADKQKITETLAIMYGVLQASYLKAIDEEDENLINQAHETAKQSLEQLLGVPMAKIKINYAGLQIQ